MFKDVIQCPHELLVLAGEHKHPHLRSQEWSYAAAFSCSYDGWKFLKMCFLSVEI